uniref:ribose-phosphate diphosphokinase n=1 Tax=Marseillevirus LCMAC202 TaxID=2506606 RepID=A0A481YXW5_9VIRU|nr:MAG: zinc finger protein [Marseillevirus LCMAC202]
MAKNGYKHGTSNRIENIVFFSGSSHPDLARMIATQLSIPISDSIQDCFSNGERRIELHANVRGRHVYILQTGCFTNNESTNDYIMELLLMINSARLSDAKSITAIIPHFPYARQDKKDRSRTPISSRLFAEMLQTAGVTRVVTMDLHSSQIQGFFTIPVDNLFARDLIIKHLETKFFTGFAQKEIQKRFVLVSPDAGGAKRVLKMAQKMELNSVLMHKQRDHSKKNHVDKTIIVGEEGCLKGKTCIIVDDMADTLGTVTKACEELIKNGARDVIVCITHGVLSGPAFERLNNCDAITHLVTSNTIPQDSTILKSSKVQVFDVSELLATCMERIVNGGSISALFR